MKIKTITCHDVYNLGAELQAYALVKYLQSLGHDVEIIDYKPIYLQHYRLTGVSNPAYDKPIVRTLYQLAKFPERVALLFSKRKKEYDDFVNEYLPRTKQRYMSNSELKSDPPSADVYIAGSDQIWNTSFSNGKDPAFYLDFVPDFGIKASYAASFAVPEIPNEWKKQIFEWISKLDYISVRERTGVEIITDLGIDRAIQVLDPVFLLSKQEWELLEKPTNINEKYILLYDFDNNENIGRFAYRYAKEHDCKIYSIFKSSFADQSFENEGPRFFLSLVARAEYIVSNSFHGTAFAVIFQKQFCVFERNESLNSRMKDFLQMLGLSDTLLYDYNKLAQRIDYKDVNKILNEKISFSKEYLNTILVTSKEH